MLNEIGAEFLPDEKSASRLVRDLVARLSLPKLADELHMSEAQLESLAKGGRALTWEDAWKLVRSASRYGFFDVLPANGMPSVSYDLANPFHLLDEPVGFQTPPPIVPLINRPTMIAGHTVDFPIGLPASVLAANSKWIEFYARRGFDILTYKVIPHPGSSNGSTGDFADSTNWTARRTEAPFALAVLTTERNAA